MPITTIRPEQIRSVPVLFYRNINLLNIGSVIKNSSGKLVAVDLRTTAASEKYVKFYDKATTPTSGDIVKITFTINSSSPATFIFPADMPFLSGIGIRATNNVADNDNAAPAANSIFVNVWYT